MQVQWKSSFRYRITVSMYHCIFHPVHCEVVSKNNKWALGGRARGVAVVKAKWIPVIFLFNTLLHVLIISPGFAIKKTVDIYMFFLVIIHVGFRIVGLDAQYSDFKGKVALEAERCANVVIPETPDPVLTSCGVVLLYQDPQSRYTA